MLKGNDVVLLCVVLFQYNTQARSAFGNQPLLEDEHRAMVHADFRKNSELQRRHEKSQHRQQVSKQSQIIMKKTRVTIETTKSETGTMLLLLMVAMRFRFCCLPRSRPTRTRGRTTPSTSSRSRCGMARSCSRRCTCRKIGRRSIRSC